MSIKASGGKLAKGARELSSKWHDTQWHWNDAKSNEFKKTYLDGLPEAVSTTVTTIDELDKLLKKIKDDCSE